MPRKIVCAVRNDEPWLSAYRANMADRNYLKAWREKRRMTQEELAEKVGTNKAVISLLENEKRPLSSTWLRKLAEVLETRPGHILDTDPAELDSDVEEIWTRIPKADRAQAIRVLHSFTKTGTNGQ